MEWSICSVKAPTLGDPTTAVGRNSETMASQVNVDARISKRFTLGGNFGFEAIVDVFNLLDRTNYTEINNIFGTGAYPTAPLPTVANNASST